MFRALRFLMTRRAVGRGSTGGAGQERLGASLKKLAFVSLASSSSGLAPKFTAAGERRLVQNEGDKAQAAMVTEKLADDGSVLRAELAELSISSLAPSRRQDYPH